MASKEWATWAALLLSGLPLWAALPNHPQVSREPEPAWIEPLLDEPSPTGGGEAERELTYLLHDHQLRLDERGEIHRFTRRMYRIESVTALEDWSSWSFDLDPTFQRLVLHRLEVFRDGAWHDRLRQSHASLLHLEEDLNRQIFDQRQTLLIVLDDLRVGDVVRLSSSLVGTNPVFRGRFTGELPLSWSIPVERFHLKIIAPRQRRLDVKVHGPGPEPMRTEVDGEQRITWDLHAVPGTDFEAGVPPAWVIYPFAQVSEYGSWRDVVDWARPLFASGGGPDELEDIAAEIRATSDTPEERLVAARNWVQDEVRYFAVIIGEHSHRPHTIGEILDRRYGDCKDKSLLLAHLLDKLDIEAWPAFVSTSWKGGIADRLPSPLAFDHVINVAQIGDRKMWIDPTMTLQGGTAEDLYVPDYQAALEIRDGVEDLTELPPDQTAPGDKQIFYRYRLSGVDEPVEVEISTFLRRHGAEDMRHTLAQSPLSEILDNYIEYYTTPEIAVEALGPIEVEDQRDVNQVTLTERYRLTYSPADEMFFTTLNQELDSSLSVPSLPRRAPFRIPFPLKQHETIEVLAPREWDLEPINEEELNPWFELRIETAPVGGGISIQYALETLTDSVPADHAAEYTAAVERLREHLGYSIGEESNSGGDLAGLALRNLLIAAALLGALTMAAQVFLRKQAHL